MKIHEITYIPFYVSVAKMTQSTAVNPTRLSPVEPLGKIMDITDSVQSYTANNF